MCANALSDRTLSGLAGSLASALLIQLLKKCKWAMTMDSKLTSFLFEATGVDRARRFLDVASMRHKLIASNVANVATPGYESLDIDFKGELAKLSGRSNHLAGMTTNPGHIPLGQHAERTPNIVRTKLGGDDLNSVDIDVEVPKMALNELEYTIGARLLKSKFDGLRKAIRGR